MNLNWFTLCREKLLIFLLSFSLVSLSMNDCCIDLLCSRYLACSYISLSAKWFESPFIVGFQICPLKRDKFEFRTFFCSCHTCSYLVVVVECFLQPQSQIFRDFLNSVHLTSDWTKFNGTQFETEIPCTNSGISVLVNNEYLTRYFSRFWNWCPSVSHKVDSCALFFLDVWSYSDLSSSWTVRNSVSLWLWICFGSWCWLN